MSEGQVGSRLGKYEIRTEIGKGGMGVVYLGYDPVLDRKVAIKVLAPHLVWEPGFIERFLREARAAARLKHAGIVTIYDVGQEANWYYIVMEYLEGQTLAQVIQRRGALPLERTVTILRRLAEALDYAHQCGLVHRDVKPGNVIVHPSGQVALTDFGVARAAQETRLTTTGALIGTPKYMSPEQARGEEADHRTDIYSLGVVAYEMLCGRAPFEATTPHAVLYQLIYEPLPPVRSRRPDLPEEVDATLAAALAKEPATRYTTAAGFVDALADALAGEGRQAAGQATVAAVPQVASQATVTAVPQPGPVALSEPARVVPQPTGHRVDEKWVVWVGWLLATALGWAAGWAVGAPISELVARPIGETGAMLAAETLGGAVAWGTLGLMTGVAQWLVLRRHMSNAGWWVPASVIGWAVAGSVRWSQGPLTEEILSGYFRMFEEMGLPWLIPLSAIVVGLMFDGVMGLVVGVAQRPVLKPHVERAGRWVLISAVALAAGAVAMGLLAWAIDRPGQEVMYRVAPVIGGIVPGALLASGLVRLMPPGRDEPTLPA
jgi:predicted Ser/Thr protein kinase